jgi:hypothetical protein
MTKKRLYDGGKLMIDKLKFLIDGCEHNPKLKALMLKVAELPENKQEDALKLIEIMIQAKRSE